MLVDIFCEDFKSYGNPRGHIKIKPGLNIVRGGKQTNNSIGKTTFLLIVDFCFGGEAYAKDKEIIANIPDNNVCFTFCFDSELFYFSRRIKTPKYVERCDKFYNPVSSIKLEEFNAFLLKKYHLDQYSSLKFRECIGRFMRVFGKNNYNQLQPLSAAARETPSKGITAIEKLFGYYESIEEQKKNVEEAKEKRDTFAKANSQGLFLISAPTKKQYEKNKKEMLSLEEDQACLTTTLDLDLTDEEIEKSEAVLDIKNEITKLKRQRSILVLKQNSVNNDGKHDFYMTDDDLKEIHELFPTINIKRLQDIESFHRKISGVLSSEKKEELEKIKNEIESIDFKINELSNCINSFDTYVNLPASYLRKSIEISKRIGALDLQNSVYEKKNQLEETLKSLNESLLSVENTILSSMENMINTELEKLNEKLNKYYPNPHYAPRIKIKSNKSYEFETPLDSGYSASFRGLAMFDLAMLNISNLPVLIHDSIIFADMQNEPLEFLMEEYANQKKQVFIAFGRYDTPTERIESIFNENVILSLGDKGNELFGISWAEKKF